MDQHEIDVIGCESPVVLHVNTTEYKDSSESSTSNLSKYQKASDIRRNKLLPLKQGKSCKRKSLDLCDSNGTYLADDVEQGYRILKQLMQFTHKNVNAPFIDLPNKEEHPEFYRMDKNCISLSDMLMKFETAAYASITEFVKDFRNMLEVYLRYFGPDDPLARRVEKLDVMIEQKLALLSKDLRELTSIEMTHGPQLTASQVLLHGGTGRRTRQTVPNFSTELINILRQENKDKEKEMRRQLQADRIKERETRFEELSAWENSLFHDKLELFCSTWELLQVGLFISLCKDVLNCGEISQYEVERFVLLPKQSSALCRLMTSLLSTPFQRQSLDRRPPMPFHVWNRKLCQKLDQFYKTLQDSNDDLDLAADKLGIESRFWHIVGHHYNPLVKFSFQELSYTQCIWIIKSLCEHTVTTQESLQEAIENQLSEDVREAVLGKDKTGAIYVYFPQICKTEVRVYTYSYSDKSREPAPQAKTTASANSTSRGRGAAKHLSSLHNYKYEDDSSERQLVKAAAKAARAMRSARRSAASELWEKAPLSTQDKEMKESEEGPDLSSAEFIRENGFSQAETTLDCLKESPHQATTQAICNDEFKENVDDVVKNEKQASNEIVDEMPNDFSDKCTYCTTKASVTYRIMGPRDFKSFRLVCQSLEDLQSLVYRFSGSLGSEAELFHNLNDLLQKLQPLDIKFQQQNLKTKEKLKKDHDSYIEPDNKNQADDWDTDEETSMKSTNGIGVSDELNHNDSESKTADLDVSAFGRIRKRRVIPNNMEDSIHFGKKKRKQEEADQQHERPKSPINPASEEKPVEQKQVVVPQGFTMIRMQEKMFLVSTAQLPSLLQSTNSSETQVRPILLRNVNTKALKNVTVKELLDQQKAPKQPIPTQEHKAADGVKYANNITVKELLDQQKAKTNSISTQGKKAPGIILVNPQSNAALTQVSNTQKSEAYMRLPKGAELAGNVVCLAAGLTGIPSIVQHVPSIGMETQATKTASQAEGQKKQYILCNTQMMQSSTLKTADGKQIILLNGGKVKGASPVTTSHPSTDVQ